MLKKKDANQNFISISLGKHENISDDVELREGDFMDIWICRVDFSLPSNRVHPET